jgi:hypothetical protein
VVQKVFNGNLCPLSHICLWSPASRQIMQKVFFAPVRSAVSSITLRCGTFLMRSSSRHQKNHTRPFKCQQCSLGFPTPKDLERHNNSVHTTTTKYFCPHDYCRDSLRPDQTSIITWGFRRKDHWQKHMRDEHQMNREGVGIYPAE